MSKSYVNREGLKKRIIKLKVRNKVIRQVIKANLEESKTRGEKPFEFTILIDEMKWNGKRILAIRKRLREDYEIHKDDE